MKGLFGFFWEILKIVILAAIIVVPIRYFLFQPFFVKGQSMVPSFENGDYVLIKGTTQLFNGNLQIIVQQLKKADESRIDESDFHTLTNEDIGQLIVQLRQFVDSIQNKTSRNALGN